LLGAGALAVAGVATSTVAALSGAGERWWWAAVAGGLAGMVAGSTAAPWVPAGRGLVGILVVAGVLRVALVPTPPVLSDDLYRYLWDGRVTVAGLDPYAEAPASPERAQLRDEVVWPRINRSDQRTVYPPLAVGVFAAADLAGVRSATAWKALTAAADLAACALLALALRRGGRDPRLVVAYAWNPLPVLAFAHAGHVDALVVLALAGAVLAWQSGRTRTVGGLLGVAAALKLFPVVLIVAFLRDRDGRLRFVHLAGVASAVLALTFLPALAGADVFGHLAEGYFDDEGFTSGNRFVLLDALGLTAGIGPVPLAALVVMAAVGVAALRSRRPAPIRGAWVLGAALALTTPAAPWYAGPLVALAVAGGTVWLWPLFAVALDVAYLGRQIETDFPAPAIRGAATLLALALTVALVARRRRSPRGGVEVR